jgi:hypothetical protein
MTLDVHAIDRYLWLTPVLGLDDAPADSRIYLSGNAVTDAQRLLDGIVCLFPNDILRPFVGSDLCRDFQRQLHLKPAGTFDKVLEGLPLYKLHRVKVVLTGSAQMEDRGNVWVPNTGVRAGFTQKTKPR